MDIHGWLAVDVFRGGEAKLTRLIPEDDATSATLALSHEFTSSTLALPMKTLQNECYF
jgi:hypothetical protein